MAEGRRPQKPEQAPPGEPATGFPEPPGRKPGDRSRHRDPHHALNTPIGEPDPTEWPDPYDRRPDPLAPSAPGEPAARGVPGATSTSQPHPDDDVEAREVEGPKRDRLDR